MMVVKKGYDKKEKLMEKLIHVLATSDKEKK